VRQPPHFAKLISRPFPGWLACVADSGPSALEGDEVARHLRHRAPRLFVARRGGNVGATQRVERPFMGRKHRDNAQPSSQQTKSGSNGGSLGFHRIVKDFNNLNCGSLEVRKMAGGKFFDREGGLDPKTIY
jgi:hypothetical protein